MNKQEYMEHEGYELQDEHRKEQVGYVDEDLIPAFHCADCEGNVCKDEVFKKYEDGQVMCLQCAEEKGLIQ